MEISTLRAAARKLTTGAFPVGEETLGVVWDKSVFTGRFIADLFEEVRRGVEDVQAQFKALREEAGKTKESDTQKIAEGRIRLLHLKADIEDVERRVYARALCENVLDSWGLTDGGEPVPITFDVIMAQPATFPEELFTFCRRESLPKSQAVPTTGASRTTAATSRSSTVRRKKIGDTRRRSARQGSATPLTSPSSNSSVSPSSNTTPA